MKISNKIAVIVFIVTITGCTIKEDRWPCPCRLIVELPDRHRFEEAGPIELAIMSAEKGKELEATIIPEDYPDGYEKEVAKGMKQVSAIAGRRSCTLHGRILQSESGNEFDRIYIHSSDVACLTERARDTIRLHKAFAEIAIEIKDPTNSHIPYRLAAECSSSGLDIASSSPAGVPMTVPLKSDRDREHGYMPLQKIDTTGRSNRLFRFICPKQNDFNMSLSIIDNEENISNPIPIGDMMRAAGYDWTTQDLKDIFISIDKAKMSISIIINDWFTGKKKEFII